MSSALEDWKLFKGQLSPLTYKCNTCCRHLFSVFPKGGYMSSIDVMNPVDLPTCSVHEWRKGTSQWRISSISHAVTGQSCEGPVGTSNSFDVTLFVVKDSASLESCRHCTEYLTESFEFLTTWREPAFHDINGYFGCEDELDEDGNIVAVETWVRFLIQRIGFAHGGDSISHSWGDITAFTHWRRETSQIKLLLVRTDEDVVERLIPLMLRYLLKSLPNDPLWPYVLIICDYMNLQHDAISGICHMTESEERRAEFTRHLNPTKPINDYARMHQVARHAITVIEILEVNFKTIDHMVKYHEGFISQSTSGPKPDITPRRLHSWQKINNRILLYTQVIWNLRLRCSSYRERMRNEIQLVFNVVSQDDTRASVEIAKAAKADSQAMKVTSFIALVFLPPTFISAVFSTTFFEYGADSKSWAVSDRIWIYWAFVLPTTFISVLTWYTCIFLNLDVHSVTRVVTQLKWRGRRWDNITEK